MAGHPESAGVVQAHADPGARAVAYPVRSAASSARSWSGSGCGPGRPWPSARATGPGPRPPDPDRTCFERDRDRILHSAAFRRLAGKTQVFVFPADHQRTRLTHALEVAQVATGIARAAGLNASLTEAIALGHDCGHGPGGHASEEAFDAFLPEGYDHAVWGADVVLVPLNLCTQTLDGIRNHSWARPTPATPEGEVVSWADRIAYCAHDFEDAVQAGVVDSGDLPDEVADVCGRTRREQLGTFIDRGLGGPERHRRRRHGPGTGRGPGRPAARSTTSGSTPGRSRWPSPPRSSPSCGPSWSTSPRTRRPCRSSTRPSSAAPDPVRAAVAYVAGMTDRFAFATAERELGWPASRLPRGIDVPAGPDD